MREAAETTIAQQRPDGLWLYADAPNMAWIDNFHTAYVLQGLSEVETAFGFGSDALDRGARAWLDYFIEARRLGALFPRSPPAPRDALLRVGYRRALSNPALLAASRTQDLLRSEYSNARSENSGFQIAAALRFGLGGTV